MAALIRVVPEHLHSSAGLVDSHAEDVRVAHASADAELGDAQAGLVGSSATAIAAKAGKWTAVSQALSARLADHSAAFRAGAAGFQTTEAGNREAIDEVGAQAGSRLG